MSNKNEMDYSPDSIAASYSQRDKWLKSAPLPVVDPIYNASTYFLPSTAVGEAIIAEKQPGYVYSRIRNPTIDVCAEVIAQLEGAQGGTLLTSSGMAAISLVFLTFLKSGDHLVCQYPVDTHTIKLIEDLMMGNKVEVTWVDNNKMDAFEKAIRANTKMVFVESPCNPSITLQDLESLGKLAQRHPQLITMVDGTFASTYVQQPLKYGVHISMHSCTKYMGGHSDITAGCVSFTNKELYKKAQWYSTFLGPSLSPFDASLLHRSLKTLPVRMERHSINAMKIAKFLEQHSKVKVVHYPGLESHPQHNIAKSQMKMFGGMISFEVDGGKEAGIKLVESVQLISLAVSLGGTGSLIEHPASLTNTESLMDEEARKKCGVADGLVRLSVGLEDADDLIKDLTQALEKL